LFVILNTFNEIIKKSKELVYCNANFNLLKAKN
jgi:hypothetical protein